MREISSQAVDQLRSKLKRTLFAELVRTVKRHYRKKKPATPAPTAPTPQPPSFNPKYTWLEPIQSHDETDLALVIAFAGRHQVLRLVIKEAFAASRVQLNVAVVLACSTDEDRAFAEEQQAKYKQIGIAVCDNQPLGNKWHIAVEAARKVSPKTILITGSDDIVSVDYMKSCYDKVQKDSLNLLGMIGPRHWYILDARETTKEPRLWRVRYRDEAHLMPLGAGRMYHATYLDSVNWEIFDRTRKVLLDDKGYYDALKRQRAIHHPEDADGMVLSVKGPWAAMNSLDRILSASSIEATEVTGPEREERLSKIDHQLPSAELSSGNAK